MSLEMQTGNVTLELDSRVSGLSQARRAVKAFVHEYCAWANEFSVQLVASELLTNALRHAGGWWHLKVRRERAGLVLEVADHDPRLPQPREPDLREGGGLGMHLISALASTFEVRPTPGGKVLRAVWLPGAA